MMYSISTQKNVLNLFNSVVFDMNQKTTNVDISLLEEFSIISDIDLNKNQKDAISSFYTPLRIKTLFTRDEREGACVFTLVTKQLFHYIEVYGLNQPGLFNLEVEEGKVVNLRFIKGISVSTLSDMVRTLLYTNAPVKDAEIIKQLINDFRITYDVNQIANNELRIILFNEATDTLKNGDDVVRYMVYKATQATLLIKNEDVIRSLSKLKFSPAFIEAHEIPLAQVFNRHKRLILAAKNRLNKTAINKVTRLSKTKHVPIIESISKKFLSLALAKKVDKFALTRMSVRDKFKILNLIEYKKEQNTSDAFIIRNGKIHIEDNRPVYSIGQLTDISDMIVASLANDLGHLHNQNILLDEAVDYGLPVSRKQSIGQLPYGTSVSVEKNISSGIYWHNDGGATDLDLSTIDADGNRIGWGAMSGYNSSDVKFSGDVTNAWDGAMEFMTSNGVDYGLFVNVFRGNVGSEFELVVGQDGKNKWLDKTIIREKGKLNSRGNIIGFVKANKLVVYQGQLNNNRWSNDTKARAIVSRGSGEFWTVKRLFDKLSINYLTQKKDGVTLHYDLTYASFSFDKLENLLMKVA